MQVLALVLVALLHLAYLRLCLPFRMRVELAAEMVASVCDLAVFACGIALIAKPTWTEGERSSMGAAMLILQVRGQGLWGRQAAEGRPRRARMRRATRAHLPSHHL